MRNIAHTLQCMSIPLMHSLQLLPYSAFSIYMHLSIPSSSIFPHTVLFRPISFPNRLTTSLQILYLLISFHFFSSLVFYTIPSHLFSFHLISSLVLFTLLFLFLIFSFLSFLYLLFFFFPSFLFSSLISQHFLLLSLSLFYVYLFFSYSPMDSPCTISLFTPLLVRKYCTKEHASL